MGQDIVGSTIVESLLGRTPRRKFPLAVDHGRYFTDLAVGCQLIVPHVAKDINWDTTVYVCNQHETSTDVTLTFVDVEGNAVHTKTCAVAGNGSGIYSIADLIGPGMSYGSGSVEITATQGVAAFVLYYDTVKMLEPVAKALALFRRTDTFRRSD